MIRLIIITSTIQILLFTKESYSQSIKMFGNDIGSFYSKGDFYGAIKYRENKIKEEKRLLSNPKNIAKTSVDLNDYIILSGEYQAYGLTHQALALLKQNEDKFISSDLDTKQGYYCSLSEIYFSLKKGDEFVVSLKKFKEALDVPENSENRMNFQARYYQLLGSYYNQNGDYDSAILPLKENYKLISILWKGKAHFDIHTLANTNNELIVALCKLGLTSEAKSYLLTTTDSAIYYQFTKQYYQSLKAYKRYRAAYSKLDSYGKLLIGENLGYYGLLCLIESPQALESITNLLEEQESILKTSFISFSEKEKKEFITRYTQKLNLYYSALLYLQDQGNEHSVELLEKSLQTKGIILDITKQQRTVLSEIINDKPLHYEQLLKLKNKIAAYSQWNPNSDSLIVYSAKLSELERNINESRNDKISVLSKIGWIEIKNRLASNESFVNVVRIERDNFKFDKEAVYYAFVIKKDSEQPQMIKLGEGKNFENKKFKLYQNSIRNQFVDTISYRTFWLPLIPYLKGINRVMFSADGVYSLISLPTLYNKSNQKYLVDEMEVIMVGSSRDFISSKAFHSSKPTTISLIGNPNFKMKRESPENMRSESVTSYDVIESITAIERAGLTPLPGTQKEVELIAELAKNSGLSVSLLNNSNATEKNVKQIINPSIMHFATHGDFDQYTKEESYLQSKLILAGAGDEEPMTVSDYEKFDDGLLTAFEVTQMNLRKTDLIVLSACETGLGELQNGEGVWGLQRAFQLAGAKNVIGSLWKISDDATVIYMEEFYKSYFSGMSIKQSYQTAMINTKSKFPHPYYWGAFILNGN